MKIGCAYHPREHIGCGKFHFIADALRNIGHDIYHVQTMDDLKRADQACDFILFEQRNPATICDVDLVEFSRHKQSAWLQWYFDLNVFDDTIPLEKQAPLVPFLEIARAMDIVFVKERDRLIDYRDIGINAVWLDQGCPSSMRQAKLKEHPDFDVILWGSASRPMWQHRWQDVEAMVRLGFEVAWATSEGSLPVGIIRLPPCQPLEIPDLVEKAAVTLIVDSRNDISGYWSDRIWLAAGSGACCIRRSGVGGGNLPAFGYFTSNSMISMIADLCTDFGERVRVGEWARAATFSSNLYEHRVQEVVKHAQRLINKGHAESDVQDLQGNEVRCDNEVGEETEDALSRLH